MPASGKAWRAGHVPGTFPRPHSLTKVTAVKTADETLQTLDPQPMRRLEAREPGFRGITNALAAELRILAEIGEVAMIRRIRRSRSRSEARSRRRKTIVSPCRCAGACHCSGLVHALLLLEIERECEFYRDTM